MKKTILIYSVFILSFFIIVPPAFADHPPEIIYVKKVAYTYTPTGGTETTVDALDINGTDLYQMREETKITPLVKFGRSEEHTSELQSR